MSTTSDAAPFKSNGGGEQCMNDVAAQLQVAAAQNFVQEKKRAKSSSSTGGAVRTKLVLPVATVADATQRVIVAQSEALDYQVYMEPRDYVPLELADRVLAELKAVPRDCRTQPEMMRDGSSRLEEWSPFVMRPYGVSKREMLTLGDPATCHGYAFSNQVSAMHAWNSDDNKYKAVLELKALLEKKTGLSLGFVHCNWYKANKGGISRHQDDEDQLHTSAKGHSNILCYSVGAGMTLEFAHGIGKKRSDFPPVARLHSEHNTLYVMAGTTQKHLFHGTAPVSKATRVPYVSFVDGEPYADGKGMKRKRVTEPDRISLTFRVLAAAPSKKNGGGGGVENVSAVPDPPPAADVSSSLTILPPDDASASSAAIEKEETPPPATAAVKELSVATMSDAEYKLYGRLLVFMDHTHCRLTKESFTDKAASVMASQGLSPGSVAAVVDAFWKDNAQHCSGCATQ